MKTIIIDWSIIRDPEGFYVTVLPQTEAPPWHGHNLAAINDSWVTGDICSGGPPFSFVFRRSQDIGPNLKEFAQTVSRIAEDSVKANGGQ